MNTTSQADVVRPNVPRPYHVATGGVVRSLKGERTTSTHLKADHVDSVPGERTTYPEGNEHFSIWLREPGTPAPRFIKAWTNEPWPEFIEGYHYDFRQPSRLLPLLARGKESNATKPQTTTTTPPEAPASPQTRG